MVSPFFQGVSPPIRRAVVVSSPPQGRRVFSPAGRGLQGWKSTFWILRLQSVGYLDPEKRKEEIWALQCQGVKECTWTPKVRRIMAVLAGLTNLGPYLNYIAGPGSPGNP